MLRRVGKVQFVFLIGLYANLIYLTFDLFYRFHESIGGIPFFFAGVGLILIKMRADGKLLLKSALLISAGILILEMNGSGFGNIVLFFWPLIIAMVLSDDLENEKFRLFLSRSALAFLAVLTAKAFLVYGAREVAPTEVNPNTTAMLIVYLYFLSECGGRKPRLGLIGRLPKVALAFAGLFQCRSRTSLAVFLLLVIGRGFLSRHIFCSKRRTMALMVSVIAAGSLFPFLYLFLFKQIGYNVVAWKDIFSGREIIWMEFIDYVRQNPGAWVMGTGSGESFYMGFNLHNTYWHMFALYGLPMACLYFILILGIIGKSFGKRRRDEADDVALLMLLGALLIGVFEITLEWIPILVFPGLALGFLRDGSGKDGFEHGVRDENGGPCQRHRARV